MGATPGWATIVVAVLVTLVQIVRTVMPQRSEHRLEVIALWLRRGRDPDDDRPPQGDQDDRDEQAGDE